MKFMYFWTLEWRLATKTNCQRFMMHCVRVFNDMQDACNRIFGNRKLLLLVILIQL